MTAPHPQIPPLRVLCVEDNPLIVFHLQQMIEDLGHRFVQAFEAFDEMRDQVDVTQIDCALVDIDLNDGRTGPDAAAWLHERGVPTLFVTGQDQLARGLGEIVVGIVTKPISEDALQAGFEAIVASRRTCRE